MFAMAELQRDLDFDLREMASGRTRGKNGVAELLTPGAASTESTGSDKEPWNGFRADQTIDIELPRRLSERIRALLPWRSLDDGTPVAMDVVVAGITQADGERPGGTLFVVVVADSWDAADAIQEALHPVGGLDDAEWVAGWTRSERGFREITIFPPQDLAA